MRNINIYVIENGFTVYDSATVKETYCKSLDEVLAKVKELLEDL